MRRMKRREIRLGAVQWPRRGHEPNESKMTAKLRRKVVSLCVFGALMAGVNNLQSGRVVAQSSTIAANLAGAGSGAIISGPDGALWFGLPNAIVRMSPSGVFTRYSLKPGQQLGSAILSIGPARTIWFNESGAVGRITMGGRITEFAIPKSQVGPGSVYLGPDGQMWYVTSRPVKTGVTSNVPLHIIIAKISLNGRITELIPSQSISPSLMVNGPDRKVWFINDAGASMGIGSLTLTGHVTLFPIPQRLSGICTPGLCYPSSLIEGTDNTIWFTLFGRGLGRLAMSGHVTYYPLPKSYGSAPKRYGPPLGAIALGLNRDLWLGTDFAAYIGHFTPAGAYTEFHVSTRADSVLGLTTGSDGNLWFILDCEYSIGRITPTGAVTLFHIPGTPRDAGSKCPAMP